MLVLESSAMHQLRRRSAQKLHLDLIADRMPLEHCEPLAFRNKLDAKTIVKAGLRDRVQSWKEQERLQRKAELGALQLGKN